MLIFTMLKLARNQTVLIRTVQTRACTQPDDADSHGASQDVYSQINPFYCIGRFTFNNMCVRSGLYSWLVYHWQFLPQHGANLASPFLMLMIMSCTTLSVCKSVWKLFSST